MVASEEDIQEEDEEIFDDIEENNDAVSTVSGLQHSRNVQTPGLFSFIFHIFFLCCFVIS